MNIQETIQEILDSNPKYNSMPKKYILVHEEYEKTYGKNNSIILIQVGSFFEAYQTSTRGPSLSNLSDLLNIICTKKDKSKEKTDLSNPYMLGFPTVSLTKYLKVLVENDFTVVVIEQTSPPPKPKREVTGIYSKGTYVGQINTPDANNIMSIYIEEETQQNTKKKIMCVGLSIIDLSTGKSLVYESYSSIVDDKYALDETIKFINSYHPKEIILNTKNIKSMSESELVLYLELNDKKYYLNSIFPKKVGTISHQTEVLNKAYPNTGLLNSIEYIGMERLNYSRISFIVLLEYAYEHSTTIINNLDKPEIYETKSSLYLGNNAMYQLNLINTDKSNVSNKFKTGCKFRSLFDVVNNTSTAMGKRFLHDSILHPLINREQILERYDAIDVLIKNKQPKYQQMEKLLSHVTDIERLHRKLSIGTLHPMEFAKLHENYKCILKLLKYVKTLNSKFHGLFDLKLIDQLEKFINLHTTIFDIKKMNCLINSIINSFLKIGVNPEVDELQEEIDGCINVIETVRDIFNDYIISDNNDKLDECGVTKYGISIKNNERDGYHYMTSKKRSLMIKQCMEEESVNYYEIGDRKLMFDKFEFKNMSSYVKIYHPEIRNINEDLKEIRFGVLDDKQNIIEQGIAQLAKKCYVNTLEVFNEKYKTFFKELVNTVSLIDFITSAAKSAVIYNYCRPNIIDQENSFVKIKQLRHPIIEQLLRNDEKEYVPNDVSLGCDYDGVQLDGIMLFGLNSVGKSSLMKAIGLSVIMAQCGYYVPASEFNYRPYENLFTRISGADNIFKGLSSFAVELLEMKAIIKRCYNNRTLVICDELCRGTENESALILTLAFIESLAKNDTNFISATHLHEITKLKRFTNLENVKCFHLHVDYDEANETLLYNRKLLEGSGRSFYGLDVAKYLITDIDFIRTANEVKDEIYNTKLMSSKTSRYNSTLIMDKCMVCDYRPRHGEIPLETHHIIEQKNTNERKYLLEKPHMHKNDRSNLCVLCQTCHDKIDFPIDGEMVEISGYTDTSNGIKLDYKIVKVSSRPKNNKYDDNTMKLVKQLKLENKGMTMKRTSAVMDTEHGIRISSSSIGKIWRGEY
jgi:DNA mismatch repair protein MutS